MSPALRGTLLWILIAGTGALLGIITAASGLLPITPGRTAELPLPHLVPSQSGGVAFRFAMVDDVIHERDLRHGNVFYEDRNRRMRELLAKNDLKEEVRLAAMDDLGVGLDFLRKHDEAIAVMREKLATQRTKSQKRDRYTTYANLGTFIIHGNLKPALAGECAARERLQEGLEHLNRALEANAGAYSGRERWQAITVEFLLAAMKDPRLLLRYDLVGNHLSDPPAVTGPLAIPARVYAGRNASAIIGYLEHARSSSKEAVHGRMLQMLREPIARVGVEGSWVEDASTLLHEPPQFDQAALGILGMWRLGGGANPHFALALAGIMERVDRPALAWACYARAAELADRFWPDETIQVGLRVHCENRQRYLAGRIGRSHDELYHQYSQRLAGGRLDTHSYEEEEAQRITEGSSTDDLPFPLEPEREIRALDTISLPLEQLSPLDPVRMVHLLPAALFGAGTFIFLASFVSGRRPSRMGRP